MNHRPATRLDPLTVLAALLLAVMAAAHTVLVPRYMDEHPVIAWLFVADAVAALVLAAAVLTRRPWAWTLTAVMAAATAVAYLLSRTGGLGGYRDDDWAERLRGVPLGWVSLAVEAALTAVALLAMVSRRRPPARAGGSTLRPEDSGGRLG
jgi:hypothetical protein